MSGRISHNATGFADLSVDDTIEGRIGRNITPLPSGCWQWKDGTKDYPMTSAYSRSLTVHRWMYFALVRTDLDERDYRDHHIHHECENKRCVNPFHLTMLTPSEHRLIHGRSS